MLLFIVQIDFIILLFRIVCCWWRIQSRTERVFNSWISRRWLQWSRSSCYSHPNWDHHIGDQDPECSWRERSTNPWTNISGTEEIWISWGNCGGLSLNSTLFITMLGKIDEKFRSPPPTFKDGKIDLVTVFDAILTSRQTCEKLQCLYENLMSTNFRKTAVLKKISIVN